MQCRFLCQINCLNGRLHLHSSVTSLWVTTALDAPLVIYAAPALAVSFVSHAPAVTYAVSAFAVEYAAPTASVTCAAPSAVIHGVAPVQVPEYFAPAWVRQRRRGIQPCSEATARVSASCHPECCSACQDLYGSVTRLWGCRICSGGRVNKSQMCSVFSSSENLFSVFLRPRLGILMRLWLRCLWLWCARPPRTRKKKQKRQSSSKDVKRHWTATCKKIAGRRIIFSIMPRAPSQNPATRNPTRPPTIP